MSLEHSINFPWGLVVFIVILILFSLCTHCCKEEQRRTIYASPVVVTSATHTAPGGYPTGVQSVAVYPTSSATGYQQAVYPQQAPYPVTGATSVMPMPMQQHQMQANQMGLNPHMMPPYPTVGPGMNPPSYETAVGPNQAAAYEKQSPYNPSYPTGY